MVLILSVYDRQVKLTISVKNIAASFLSIFFELDVILSLTLINYQSKSYPNLVNKLIVVQKDKLKLFADLKL